MRQQELPLWRCYRCGRTFRRFGWYWRHVPRCRVTTFLDWLRANG